MKTPFQEKVILTGFMGAGKSTVLAELAALVTDWKCVDLDSLLNKDKELLADWIHKIGWEAFRHEELRALKHQLEKPGPWFLALGGGSLSLGLPAIKQTPGAVLIYVAAPFETLWERIRSHAQEKPLVQQGEESLRRLFHERVPLYEQSQFTVDGTAQPREVALAILRLVGLA